MDNELQKLLSTIRNTYSEKITKEMCSIQPMPNDIDLKKLAESPLWQSFCNRHFKHLDE